MKKINYPLIIGTIILVILFLVSMYPDAFTKADPYGKQRLEYRVGETAELVIPPFAPSYEYPWGTDNMGRDLRSLIVFGCKITMMIALTIALGRLLIALPIALAAAYKSKIANWLIRQFNILFGAFPLILLVLLLSRVSLFYNPAMGEWGVISLLLVFLGWSKLSYLLVEKVKEVLDQDFIEGEIAIGKTKLEIAIQNIIPHIIPSIAILFFLEIAMVLLTMAQIGILDLLLTGGYYSRSFVGDTLRVPYQFDWANLLSLANIYLQSRKFWLIFYPASAFAISIIGFNLFGEGLRIEYEKRSSKFITFLRKLPQWFSPMRFIYEIKNIKDNRKIVYKKSFVILLALTIAFFPQPKSPYRFDNVNAISQLTELVDEKYNGRIAGSSENKMLAGYIADKLKEYGIEPLGKTYLDEFDINESFNNYDADITIKSENNDDIKLEFRNDFITYSLFQGTGSYELLKVDDKQIKMWNPVDYDWSDKILIIDLRTFDSYEYTSISGMLKRFIKPKGIVFIDNWLSQKDFVKRIRYSRDFDGLFTIIVSSNVGEQIKTLKSAQIDFDIKLDYFHESKGYNVAGCIRGTDSSSDEYVIIGSNFDYIGNDTDKKYPGASSIGAAAMELELARAIKESGIKPKNTIVFAFWDGIYSGSRGTRSFADHYFNDPNKKYFYVDLKNLYTNSAKNLIIDTSFVAPKNEWAQSKIKALKNSAVKNDIDYIFGTVNSQNKESFKLPNMAIVVIDNMENKSKTFTPEDDLSNINTQKYKDVGQMLLDTIIKSSGAEVK